MLETTFLTVTRTHTVGIAASNDTTSDHAQDEEDDEFYDDEDLLDDDEWLEQRNENYIRHNQTNNTKHFPLKKM